MTKDTLSETAALRALLSETPDTHVLAEMLGFVADRLMALDVDQLCGAGAHERSADCQCRLKFSQKCRSKIPHFRGPVIGRFRDRLSRFSMGGHGALVLVVV